MNKGFTQEKSISLNIIYQCPYIRRLELTENISENNTVYIVTSFRIKTEIGISCEEIFHLRIVKYLSSLSHLCEKRY